VRESFRRAVSRLMGNMGTATSAIDQDRSIALFPQSGLSAMLRTKIGHGMIMGALTRGHDPHLVSDRFVHERETGHKG